MTLMSQDSLQGQYVAAIHHEVTGERVPPGVGHLSVG